MFRNLFKLCLASLFLFLAACASKPSESDTSGNDNLDVRVNPSSKSSDTDTGTGNNGAVTDPSLLGGSEWGDDNNAWNTGYSIDYLRSLGIDRNPVDYDTVYFPYNSSSIDERGKIILEAHARQLQTFGTTNVVLEGHADERGTREYNLALGERRAQSAQDLMNATGTGTSAIQVLSYGEERAVILEQNESAWQANRRVQILY